MSDEVLRSVQMVGDSSPRPIPEHLYLLFRSVNQGAGIGEDRSGTYRIQPGTGLVQPVPDRT